MNNQEIAKIFYEMAQYLEMQDVAFKPQAYEKAALTLETLAENIDDVYKNGGKEALENLPGVGKGIAEKIIEYLKTGRIKEHRDFKKKMPIKIEELVNVEGIGSKMAGALYKHLKIKNLDDLERAAKEGKIRGLPYFGIKTEQNILQSIEFLKRSKGRFLLGETFPIAREIEEKLKALKEVEEISSAGSIRRMKETIGDIDFLVVSKNPAVVMDFFCSLPAIVKIWGKGMTRSSVRMNQEFDIDVRVVPRKSFGSALQYFTGSKEHNIALRKLAMERGLRVNEYGVFKGSKMVAGKTEEEVYKSIGLQYIEPELRENQGEIEAASKPVFQPGKRIKKDSAGLPKLIGYNDILGDLHVHSNWNGGAHSIEELAEAAFKIGYQYIGIADHTKFLRIERGLDENQLLKQAEEIKKLNSKFKIFTPTPKFGVGARNSKFWILQGCEANIMADGSLDINDECLAKLDYVIAGVHSQLKMSKEEMTKRINKAMKNPYVSIISHPTGRIIKKRDEYEIDFDEMLKTAKETGAILEINSYPARLDLNDSKIRKAKEMGVRMIINSDSHNKDQLHFMEYGISQARRGWLEKKDVVNAWPLEKILEFLGKKTPYA